MVDFQTMQQLVSRNVQCPYCGETIEVLIDRSVDEQSYIEDCQVCCRPIEFEVTLGEDGTLYVVVSHENEQKREQATGNDDGTDKTIKDTSVPGCR